MADALDYVVKEFNPHTVIDVATLTGAIDVALGPVYSGVFTSTQRLWDALDSAAKKAGENFWRMPFNSEYRKLLTSATNTADICNISNGRGAGACTAAAFLKDFVLPPNPDANTADLSGDENNLSSNIQYAHIDMASVMMSSSTSGYHVKGMSGKWCTMYTSFRI